MGRKLGKPLNLTLERMMEALGARDLKALSVSLGADESTVRNWHKRESVPFGWVQRVSAMTDHPLEWFFESHSSEAAGQGGTAQRQRGERSNAPSTAHLGGAPANPAAPPDLGGALPLQSLGVRLPGEPASGRPPAAAEPSPSFFARGGLLVTRHGGSAAAHEEHAFAGIETADHPEVDNRAPHLHSPAGGKQAKAAATPLMFKAQVPGSSSTVEYEVIPKHRGASGGDERDALLGDVAFSVPFMVRRFGGRHGYEMLYMRGDSMEPTLTEDDEIVIDTNIRRVDVSGIYAISIGDAIMIQRVQRNLDGSLIVMSDNQRYKPTTLARSEVGTLQIVGRMVWPRVR
ncbi:MAG: LexA family transcriptional regulator [Burkholderiales bacterium]|nr:LexA family transcriptional regulator [Burkholderiales bacterium]